MRTIDRRRPVIVAGGRVLAGAACIACGVVAACTRDRPSRATTSVPAESAAAVPSPPAVPPAVASGWDAAAGGALLVRGEGGEAFVVVPGEGGGGEPATDRTAGLATTVLPGDVALFSRAGAAGHANATPTAAGSATGCAWPAARLGPASGADALPAWTVGFVGDSPAPLALDSIEGASAADSASLAAAVTRLAAGLPDDTVRTFHGVPFTVTAARRFTVGDGAAARDALVATVTRVLNQEARPLGERVLLVAERPHAASGAPGAAAPWAVVYHERAAGAEDVVPATDVLAAVTLGAPPEQRPMLVLARALADGTRYTLLERGSEGWRVRWTSATRGC